MNRWLVGARLRTLPAAVVPVALGASLAAGESGAVWWRVVPAGIVSLALQVGVNYANDYSDGVRGTDDDRVGPTRLVASGLAEPSEVKQAAFSAFGVAALAGLVLAAAMFSPIAAMGADSRGACATPAEVERVRAGTCRVRRPGRWGRLPSGSYGVAP